MKARRSSAPVKISPTPQRALEITQHKKMLKMKIAPDSMLKTHELSYFHDELLKGKEISKNILNSEFTKDV
jgi:hypothetical protein